MARDRGGDGSDAGALCVLRLTRGCEGYDVNDQPKGKPSRVVYCKFNEKRDDTENAENIGTIREQELSRREKTIDVYSRMIDLTMKTIGDCPSWFALKLQRIGRPSFLRFCV